MESLGLARILISDDVADTAMAGAIRRNAAGVPIVDRASSQEIERLLRLGTTEGKRVLVVRRFLGRSFKRCQGFKDEYACCHLHTIADANHCAMECAYCILQYYMTRPHLSVFANTEDLIAEVARATAFRPRRVYRVTTGELGDSLILDPLTEASPTWVRSVHRLPNAVLELKTKSDHVDRLLDVEPCGRTVISWSVNPPEVIGREELKTASLERRLRAASLVASRGYAVGFHLDPMIYYPDWKTGYRDLLDALLDAVKPERIAWISLGSLRFPLELKEHLLARFPRSSLRHGELVPCPDGKLRYIRPIRLEMFRWAVEHLRNRFRGSAAPPLVYLCMEPPDTWRRVFGESAPTSQELDHRFAETYRARFPEAGLTPSRLEDYESEDPGRLSAEAHRDDA